MSRPIFGRHADGTHGPLEFEHVPYELVTTDDGNTLRVAADWLLDRGHEHLPRYLMATADLWDAGIGSRLADLVAWFEDWRAGDPPIPQPAVWCRYGDDMWSRARLESVGRVRIRCRREPRRSGTSRTACIRAWWDIHGRLPGNVRPTVGLHQYHNEANAAFARALRRRTM